MQFETDTGANAPLCPLKITENMPRINLSSNNIVITLFTSILQFSLVTNNETNSNTSHIISSQLTILTKNMKPRWLAQSMAIHFNGTVD